MKKILIIILIFIIPFLFSCSDDKLAPGMVEGSKSDQKNFKTVLKLKKEKIIETYEAVGTVRPLTETSVEAQISAQILKVMGTPGKKIKKGDVLIYLDARNEETQLDKAKEGLAFARNNLKQALKSKDAAEADLDKAKAKFNRTSKLFKSGVISSQQLEIDKAAFLRARAMLEHAKEAVLAARTGIRQAEQGITQAEIILGYAIIRAPASGVIIDRKADPGDLAVPGKPLLTLQTSGSLRLEASIREEMISRIRKGGTYNVNIETIGRIIPSVVEEIVPYADPDTRTFLVKTTLPRVPGLYPGMFGRLQVPLEEKEVVLIPKAALRIIGQLELVNIQDKEGRWKTIYIKTGKVYKDKIEVLSGLAGNETLGY